MKIVLVILSTTPSCGSERRRLARAGSLGLTTLLPPTGGILLVIVRSIRNGRLCHPT
jgi:hypothetical protein